MLQRLGAAGKTTNKQAQITSYMRKIVTYSDAKQAAFVKSERIKKVLAAVRAGAKSGVGGATIRGRKKGKDQVKGIKGTGNGQRKGGKGRRSSKRKRESPTGIEPEGSGKEFKEKKAKR